MAKTASRNFGFKPVFKHETFGQCSATVFQACSTTKGFAFCVSKFCLKLRHLDQVSQEFVYFGLIICFSKNKRTSTLLKKSSQEKILEWKLQKIEKFRNNFQTLKFKVSRFWSVNALKKILMTEENLAVDITVATLMEAIKITWPSKIWKFDGLSDSTSSESKPRKFANFKLKLTSKSGYPGRFLTITKFKFLASHFTQTQRIIDTLCKTIIKRFHI